MTRRDGGVNRVRNPKTRRDGYGLFTSLFYGTTLTTDVASSVHDTPGRAGGCDETRYRPTLGVRRQGGAPDSSNKRVCDRSRLREERRLSRDFLQTTEVSPEREHETVLTSKLR